MKIYLTEEERKFILKKYMKSGLSYQKAKEKLWILRKKIKEARPHRRVKEVIVVDDFKDAFKKIVGIM